MRVRWSANCRPTLSWGMAMVERSETPAALRHSYVTWSSLCSRAIWLYGERMKMLRGAASFVKIRSCWAPYCDHVVGRSVLIDCGQTQWCESCLRKRLCHFLFTRAGMLGVWKAEAGNQRKSPSARQDVIRCLCNSKLLIGAGAKQSKLVRFSVEQIEPNGSLESSPCLVSEVKSGSHGVKENLRHLVGYL